MIVPLAPLQLLVGDATGLMVGEHQPAKLAAMEGQWETEVMPLRLFAIPDQLHEGNRFELAIPKLGSLIDEHSLTAPVRGLKEFRPADRPNSLIVFWSFRIMVGLGILMIAIAVVSPILLWRHKLYANRLVLRLLVCMSPAGFVAILAGWYTSEIGRQPYVIYGVLRTADVVSPVSAYSVGLSLLLFVMVYFSVFGAGFWYLLRAIQIGPVEVAFPTAPRFGHRPLWAFIKPAQRSGTRP
jgi:cytochrome d ubiquinol oxidase subunit I